VWVTFPIELTVVFEDDPLSRDRVVYEEQFVDEDTVGTAIALITDLFAVDPSVVVMARESRSPSRDTPMFALERNRLTIVFRWDLIELQIEFCGEERRWNVRANDTFGDTFVDLVHVMECSECIILVNGRAPNPGAKVADVRDAKIKVFAEEEQRSYTCFAGGKPFQIQSRRWPSVGDFRDHLARLLQCPAAEVRFLVHGRPLSPTTHWFDLPQDELVEVRTAHETHMFRFGGDQTGFPMLRRGRAPSSTTHSRASFCRSGTPPAVSSAIA
jgi:hypothetical protein